MTIAHVQNQVIGSLCVKDTFGPSEIAAIRVTPELEDSKAALVALAMTDLVEAKMVAQVASDRWILRAPLPQNGLDLHVSLQTASEIADIINTDLDAKGIDDQVNVLSLHEGHIICLLDILNEILAADSPQDPAND